MRDRVSELLGQGPPSPSQGSTPATPLDRLSGSVERYLRGGPISYEIEEGTRYDTTFRVSAERVSRFAELSGDRNPIHVDRAAARRYGLASEVAHGAILVSELSRVIGMELPGPGALWVSSELEFLAPVFVDEELEVSVCVKHTSPAFQLVVLDIVVTRCGTGKGVFRGSATVKIMDEQMPLNFTPLAEQTVLVTGGTRGLGRAIATALIGRGASVVACYRSDVAAADAFESSLGDSAERLRCVRCDVSDPEAIASLFGSLADTRIQSLIHCASPELADVPVDSLEWSHFEPFLDTYVRGGLELVKGCLPSFQDAKNGRVVFVGSEAARQPRPNWTHYVTAKSALAGLTRSLAVELAAMGTTVNMVSPGAIHTSSQFPVGAKAMIKNATPLNRLVTEEEIAEVVLFLLEGGGSFITGTDLPLSGGRIFLS